MESNFDKYVMGQTMGKFHVTSVHLWLEHLLALSLRVVIPNPEPLFGDRGVSFSLLIGLCEAHQIIDSPLAEALRKLNAIRNKCAHQLMFNPREQDWAALSAAVDRVVPPDGGEDKDALRRLAEFVEQKAVAIGAIDPNDA
jgi:hypothetical protein